MDTERNLLFGVLALQADLIDNNQFAEACSAWSTRKHSPLADLLVERGWLTPADKALVERLLEQKLKKHGGDGQASLADVVGDRVRQALGTIDDQDLRKSLAPLTPSPQGHVLLSTTDSLPEARQRYTLTRLHATGGIGRVWLARDANLGRDIALKEIRPERAGNPVQWSRFLKEAQITSQLEHPGIVPVYELGQRPEDQMPFYTMRFVRGRTLDEAIRAYHRQRSQNEAGPLDLRNLLTAFVGICHAVAYAHSRGVIHRDLKPENAVLGDYGEVIVLDWGLARLVDQPEADADAGPLPVQVVPGEKVEATVQGQVLGTPAYMAPEQAEGRLDQIGPGTDVYGLGATLYKILTGRPPFTGSETARVLRQIVQEPPVHPRGLVATTPRALEAVCLKALAKKPAERYASVQDLCQDVQRWLADEPVSVHREPWSKRAGRWARRHPALVAGAAVLLVTAVVALSLSTMLIDRERARAEESFRQARATVDDYFTTVSESRLLDVPGLQPLRKELLEKALHYYESFLHQRGDDRAVQAETAATAYRVARISQMLGSADAAEASYRKALDLYEQLVRVHPGVAKYQSDLAICSNDFGNWLRSVGQPAEALRLHRQALGYREALVRAHPNNARFHNELAKSNANLGGMLYASGQPDEALASYEKARAINEALVRARSNVLEFPTDLGRAYNTPRTFLFDLALNYGAISSVQDHLGQSAEALRSSRLAAALLDGLAAAHPGKAEFRSHLVGCYNQTGYLLSRSGQFAEGWDSFQKARKLLERLVAENPLVPDFQSQLAGTYNSLGRLKRDQGQAAEARPFHHQALAIQERLVREYPSVVGYQATLAYLHRSLGRLHAQTGQSAEAVQAFRQAQAIDEPHAANSPLSCYNLACDLALGIPVVDASERTRVADQALETLRRALRAGYQDVNLIKTDPDLDALRAREDFQRLLQELETQAKADRP